MNNTTPAARPARKDWAAIHAACDAARVQGIDTVRGVRALSSDLAYEVGHGDHRVGAREAAKALGVTVAQLAAIEDLPGTMGFAEAAERVLG
jgi:hypothetical protein